MRYLRFRRGSCRPLALLPAATSRLALVLRRSADRTLLAAFLTALLNSPVCENFPYWYLGSFCDDRTEGERMKSAREEVLLRGLIDWVALERVHRRVAREHPGEPLSVIQDKTLDLIRSLVSDGLFEVGDLSGEGGRFVAWNTPLDESIQRIRDVYVPKFGDESAWWFCCWLDLTDKGQQVAEAIEASAESAHGS